jgi:hypothetical protein
MGTDYLVEQVKGLLHGSNNSSSSRNGTTPIGSAASMPNTVEDLVAQSIMFARQAGFLHDEVRLQQFVGLLAGVAQHAAVRRAVPPAHRSGDTAACAVRAEGRDSDDGKSSDDDDSDDDDSDDQDSDDEVAKATPRRGPVGSNDGGGVENTSRRQQLKIDTARGPIVPAPDTPRSRRPEGASPTSVSPTRMRPSEAPQSLLTLFAAFMRDMPVRV